MKKKKRSWLSWPAAPLAIGLAAAGFYALTLIHPFSSSLQSNITVAQNQSMLSSSTVSCLNFPQSFVFNTNNSRRPSSLTATLASTTPKAHALYWGQANDQVAAYQLQSSGDNFYVNQLEVTLNTTTLQSIKQLSLAYKDKLGKTYYSIGNAVSDNVGYGSTAIRFQFPDAHRLYVSSATPAIVNLRATIKTKTDGLTNDNNNVAVTAYLTSNGFQAIADNSSGVISGDGCYIAAKTMHVYRVFPEFHLESFPLPYHLVGNPTVLKLKVTAKGLTDSNLVFDDRASASGMTLNTASSSNTTYSSGITLNVSDSGESKSIPTSYAVYDQYNTRYDHGVISNGVLHIHFDDYNLRIGGNSSKSLLITLLNADKTYTKAGDFFRLTLNDKDNVASWIATDTGSDTDPVVHSVQGSLRVLPLVGPKITY